MNADKKTDKGIVVPDFMEHNIFADPVNPVSSKELHCMSPDTDDPILMERFASPFNKNKEK